MKNETETEDEVKTRETESEENGDPGEETARLRERIAVLEQTISGKDSEIGKLRQTGQELETRCRTLGDSLGDAVSGYREMVIRNNPEILGDMISGDTIESVNESLESARVLVNRVRQGLEAEITQTRVPAGAPERSVPDISSLSPGEKIRYALGGNE